MRRYHHFTYVCHRLSSDDIRFLRYDVWQMWLFLILGYFLPFYSLNSPKNQNFEKMKKISGDIIILHNCTTNYDQMMYGSWNMVRYRCNGCFSFWAIFCAFTPLTAKKIKILKSWTKGKEISSFYIRVPQIIIRWCTVPEIWCVTDAIVISHFGLFFALLLP